MLIDARFKRGLEHNYIVINRDEDIDDNYQFMMLKYNKIPGLLEFDCKNNNGIVELYYEVSSMQPLKVVYENNVIDYEALKNIINGIYFSIKNINEYLLDENSIILDPEYIFICVEDYQVKLLFYPDNSDGINNGFLSLAEFILERVNHQNAKAVMLAYNIFKIVRTDRFTMEDLIRQINETEENSSDNDINENNKDDNKKEYKEETINNKLIDECDLDNSLNEEQDNATSNNKTKKSFWNRLLFRNKKQEKNEILEQIMNDSFEEEKYEFENHEEVENVYGKTTLLLPDEMKKIEANDLRMAHSLTDIRSGKKYVINKFPAVVGKVSGMVDVVIEDSTVSRMHATLLNENGAIILKDLGSSNGSYVNGLIIENEIPLEPDDEVAFGSVRMIWQ